MDIDLFAWFILLVPLCIFLSTLLKVTKPGPNPNLPPGPRKLPLIGNLHQLLASYQPSHRILTDLALKHGPVMHLQLGEISTVVVSSPEAAKEVMKTHDITFSNRPSLIATEILFHNNSSMSFAPYGEYWRQLRKICMMELFSARRVQSFQPLREEEYLNMCKWIASKEGLPINLTEKINLTTCNTVMRASLGNMRSELATFLSIVHEATDLLSGFYMADLYPSIKLFRLFSGIKGRSERLCETSDRILENIINNHKEGNAESKQCQDFVDVLLKFNQGGHDLHITIENIKSVLMEIFNAGIETSSTTTVWAMAELMRHPRVFPKAQDEVRLVFKDKGFVHESHFDELTYLKSVIKETLRMHPPAPLLLPRESSEHCKIHGYEIPAKTRVLVNVWAIGRDPKYWKEADSFIPERHLDSSVDYKGKNFEYLPFGGGRRICPGMLFGIANVVLPLAMLLYHFDWILPDGMKPENLDMTETFGVTARRKNPLYAIPFIKKPLLM